MSERKMGFWSVFAIVVGSQIGTGIFITPVSLAPFGLYTIVGWIIAGGGAISLSLVFANLCAKFPKTGGAHIYITQAFGEKAGFFVGWTYWVISWVSTTAVIKGCIGYLTPLIDIQSKEISLLLEIGLLASISLLNLKGTATAGRAEFILTIAKFIPLLVVPIGAISYFDINNFVVESQISQLPVSTILGQVTLLTLWGFVGLECTTTAAGSIENPSRTIPKAVVWGTSTVAAIYLLNSVSVMGLIPGNDLIGSQAPYVDAADKVFGSKMALIISCIACIICIGTLNAWVLVSGQIALGLSQSGLLPKFFGHTNKRGAPVYAILLSAMGIIPLLVLTIQDSLSGQITLIIDFSVTAFLFVYLSCCIAFFKLNLARKTLTIMNVLIGSVATVFCSWVIWEIPLSTLMISSSFTLTAIPFYIWYARKGAALPA